MYTYLCPNGHISHSAAADEPSGGCGTCESPYSRRLTDAQEAAVKRLRDQRGEFTAHLSPFDLPNGYVMLHFGGGQTVAGGFTCGVSPEGDVSS